MKYRLIIGFVLIFNFCLENLYGQNTPTEFSYKNVNGALYVTKTQIVNDSFMIRFTVEWRKGKAVKTDKNSQLVLKWSDILAPKPVENISKKWSPNEYTCFNSQSYQIKFRLQPKTPHSNFKLVFKNFLYAPTLANVSKKAFKTLKPVKFNKSITVSFTASDFFSKSRNTFLAFVNNQNKVTCDSMSNQITSLITVIADQEAKLVQDNKALTEYEMSYYRSLIDTVNAKYNEIIQKEASFLKFAKDEDLEKPIVEKAKKRFEKRNSAIETNIDKLKETIDSILKFDNKHLLISYLPYIGGGLALFAAILIGITMWYRIKRSNIKNKYKN